jgi:phosphoglycerate dehydrogenase-like enzyme
LTPLVVVLPAGAARGEAWIRERNPDVELRLVGHEERDGLAAALEGADAVVAAELAAADTARADRLRLIQVLGAGSDGIERAAIPPGCALCNVHEHETAIGEWALMMMLALTRRLLPYDAALRRGQWGTAVFFDGEPELDLAGRRLGLVGFGHIGRHVARLASAIGMRVAAVTRSPAAHATARDAVGLEWLGDLSELPRLFAESDVVVVCVPLTPETEGLIGRAELEALGPGGHLVNVGRGPVVQEDALYEALVARTIAGAAIDVWYRYPERAGIEQLPATRPFWTLDNVVMTPHSSGWSASTLAGRWRFIADQIAALREGKPLRNVVVG